MICLFQFDLGDGPVVIATHREKRYNTGTWHRVDATRDGRNGLLKVDGMKVGQREAPGRSVNLNVMSYNYPFRFKSKMYIQ